VPGSHVENPPLSKDFLRRCRDFGKKHSENMQGVLVPVSQ